MKHTFIYRVYVYSPPEGKVSVRLPSLSVEGYVSVHRKSWRGLKRMEWNF